MESTGGIHRFLRKDYWTDVYLCPILFLKINPICQKLALRHFISLWNSFPQTFYSYKVKAFLTLQGVFSDSLHWRLVSPQDTEAVWT